MKNQTTEINFDEEDRLLKLYYIRLKSTFELLSKWSSEAEKNKKEKETIKALIEADESYDNGNEIEQKMVFVMDTNMIDFEIERKLLDSKSYFNDDYIKLYKDRVVNLNSEGDEIKKKKFLLRLIQDIQWQIRKRQSMEPDVEKLRMIMMGGMFLSIVFTLIAYRYIYEYSGPNRYYFTLVISAGGMGTIFSMLIGVAKHSNEMIVDNLLSSWHIGAKIVLGVGAALLFYYFFQSKLIPLGLFPDINQLDRFLDWKQCNASDDDIRSKCLIKYDKILTEKITEWDVSLYKLIIWSFLAGFSEQLVPDILNKTKSQINSSV